MRGFRGGIMGGVGMAVAAAAASLGVMSPAPTAPASEPARSRPFGKKSGHQRSKGRSDRGVIVDRVTSINKLQRNARAGGGLMKPGKKALQRYGRPPL